VQLLQPAFAAGVHTALLTLGWRAEMQRELDSIAAPLALCELTGKLAHVTPRLLAVLQTDAEGTRVLAQVGRIAQEVGALLHRPGRPANARLPLPVQTCGTMAGYYVLRATLIQNTDLLGTAPLILVTVDPPIRDVLPSLTALQARYGFTGRETEVAQLLAEGRRNRDIASTLRVTEHTARRHTERVLQKLAVPNRAAVAAALRSGWNRTAQVANTGADAGRA